MYNIPYFKPPEIKYPELESKFKEITTSGIYTKGQHRSELESQLKEYLGVEHVITTSSGTAALITALSVLRYTINCDVIYIPAFNWPSDIIAAKMAGLKPVCQDINRETWHSNVNQYTQYATLLLDTFGSVDLQDYSFPYIVDATHSLGAPNSKKHGIGSRGYAECFSMAATKPVTAGEGGFITTDDPEFASQCRDIADMCFRLPELSCVLAMAYIEHIDDLIAEKHKIAEYYKKHLPYKFQEITHCTTYSKIAFMTDTPEESEQIIAHAADAGVECRVYYKPLISMKNTDFVYERIVCLPSWIGVDVEKVVNALN